MEGPSKPYINPQSRWENPSLQNAISLTRAGWEPVGAGS